MADKTSDRYIRQVLIPVMPTVRDLAVGLAAELRWAGQTIAPWSVMHHILAGLTLIPMDEPVAVFTGEKRVPFPGSHHRDARIVIESELPLPFTLLGFSAGQKTQDNI
ncbi:MAG: hypothetical protein IIB54_04930 [Planctomycetes bacterium]|nr:hypothetical protein [Planctomycetota bacterium]